MVEAEARGEEFIPPPFQFDLRVKELNDMHYQRSVEESEALLRDEAA